MSNEVVTELMIQPNLPGFSRSGKEKNQLLKSWEKAIDLSSHSELFAQNNAEPINTETQRSTLVNSNQLQQEKSGVEHVLVDSNEQRFQQLSLQQNRLRQLSYQVSQNRHYATETVAVTPQLQVRNGVGNNSTIAKSNTNPLQSSQVANYFKQSYIIPKQAIHWQLQQQQLTVFIRDYQEIEKKSVNAFYDDLKKMCTEFQIELNDVIINGQPISAFFAVQE
ncbi:hypothetical protein [Spartinivicinus ruber]|uniref:hypothetical protein n=1 Tax=Spartinivicinus ruber TaxID=2683272 RepID=UPI0013CFD16D|nr:hypothetical protein [Spartinivicinus ruber]